MNNALDILNKELIEIFDNVMRAEAVSIVKAYDFELSMTEVHTIAAIGIDALKSMSEIAEKLHITVGTLTVAINNLVRKGYVERFKSEKDRRIVRVGLTKQGKKVYHVHEKFHAELVDALVDGLNDGDMDIVARSLSNLDDFVAKCYKKC